MSFRRCKDFFFLFNDMKIFLSEIKDLKNVPGWTGRFSFIVYLDNISRIILKTLKLGVFIVSQQKLTLLKMSTL